MNKYISYCGLNCETCEARIATINNDNELRKKVATEWSKLNNVEIKPDDINCVGCKIDGVKTSYCNYLCEVRKCAISHKYDICSECSKLNQCEKIKPFLNNKEAFNNLMKKSNKINITAGNMLNQLLINKYKEEVFVPFNEAMNKGSYNSTLFSDAFISERAKEHSVTVNEYKENMKQFIDLLNHLNEYDVITLWFGDEEFCLKNIDVVLKTLNEYKYNGTIVLNTVNEYTGDILNVKTIK